MLVTPAWKRYNTQNEALMIITGPHKMSSIDYPHSEIKMLQVKDYLILLCSISGTLSRHRECLSPHHHDGSSTEGNKGDILHLT